MASFLQVAFVAIGSFFLLGFVWGFSLPSVGLEMNVDGTDYRLLGTDNPAAFLDIRMKGLATFLLGTTVLAAGLGWWAATRKFMRANPLTPLYLALLCFGGAWLCHYCGMYLAIALHPVPQPGQSGAIVQPIEVGSFLLLPAFSATVTSWLAVATMSEDDPGIPAADDAGIPDAAPRA